MLPYRVHEVKIFPHYYEAVADGRKPFEVRLNDRNYRVGDRILLCEWDNDRGFTGRRLAARITYVLESCHLVSGFVVLGLGNIHPCY